MEKLIRSLHHITATVDDAQQDLDFFAKLLSLRLVKRTVNFDNHHVYHFYYGNERGTPGTIMTTFPYKGKGIRVGTKGAGQITVTSFSVPEGSLDYWRRRLAQEGLAVRDRAPRFGEAALTVSDASGLVLELVANDRDRRAPWMQGDVPPTNAVRGLHSVTLTIRDPAKTRSLLTDVLGFEVVNEAADRARYGVNGEEPGTFIEVVRAPDAPAAVNGLGTVHHVAFAVSDGDEQLRMRSELLRLGFRVTEVMDRQYFRSIYFREPGGVLFEIATVPPGFAIDEDAGQLGRALKLPPWEEPNRAAIEAALPKVVS
ncbi:MAG: ring-cleaving dioxygenase [Gemmatimonadetes bacterium]|nr:ring-cleaving dioxygenase [Gemmatimonadota bacterium]